MMDERFPAKWRLLDAAVDLFSRRGFQAVTLADVAGRAGLAPATAVYHYGTKERLYEAALLVALEELRPALPEPGVGGAEAVAGIVHDLLGAPVGDTLARLLALETLKPTGRLPAVLAGWREGPLAAAREAVLRLVAEARAPVSADAAPGGDAVETMAHWLVDQCFGARMARPGGGPPEPAEVDLIARLAIAGLTAAVAGALPLSGAAPRSEPAAARRLRAVRAVKR